MSALTLREALPSRRTEDWKYSDLRAALRDRPVPDRPAPEDGEYIAALASATRTIDLAAGQKRTTIERLDGDDADARAFRFTLAEGAELTRIVLQTGGGVPLSTAAIRLGPGARLRQFVFAIGADLARLETHVRVEGAGAAVSLDAIYLAADGRHADITTRVIHAAPGSATTQLVKGAARAGGRGVFQGRIVVEEGAQKTDARQTHRALMLADGAEIDAKPELEIYADDVQCAHGNTIGALDEAALFYLRSRGIPETEGRAMLTRAFLAEAIPNWLDASVRSEIDAAIDAWLEAAR